MPQKLTDMERRILDYLIDYLRHNTYQPSVREIGQQFGIKSTKTVSDQLQVLADKGWLERDPSRSRGLRIIGLDLRPDVVRVPFVLPGNHGEPWEGGPGAPGLYWDRRLVGLNGPFSVVMDGHYMEPLGIWDGDTLLVQPASEGDLVDGDIVVVRNKGRIQVMGYVGGVSPPLANDSQAGRVPIFMASEETGELLGRVVGLHRRLRAPRGDSDVVAGLDAHDEE